MPSFRVHFASGVKLDVAAETSQAAQAAASHKHPKTPVTKIKVVRS